MIDPMDTPSETDSILAPASWHATPSSAHSRPCNAIIAGSILGDLRQLARDLYRVLHSHPITVWMNADAEILYQATGTAPDTITDWIAGTYDINAAPADIEGDLRSLKAERRATGILDD
jgi:hypothetical protein